MLRPNALVLIVALSGCANQCGDGGSSAAPVEVVDAATIQEGKLGHAATLSPTRPQVEGLHPITLGHPAPSASADQ